MAEITKEERINIDQYLREEFLSDNFHHTANAAAESFIRYRSRYFDNLMPNSKSDLENHITNLMVLINLMMDKGVISREKIEEEVAKRQKSLNYDMESLFIRHLTNDKIKISLDPKMFEPESHKDVDPEILKAEDEAREKEMEELRKKQMEEYEAEQKRIHEEAEAKKAAESNNEV